MPMFPISDLRCTLFSSIQNRWPYFCDRSKIERIREPRFPHSNTVSARGGERGTGFPHFSNIKALSLSIYLTSLMKQDIIRRKGGKMHDFSSNITLAEIASNWKQDFKAVREVPLVRVVCCLPKHISHTYSNLPIYHNIRLYVQTMYLRKDTHIMRYTILW